MSERIYTEDESDVRASVHLTALQAERLAGQIRTAAEASLAAEDES